MGLKRVSGTILIVAVVGGQTAHGMEPPDLKKYHLDVEKYQLMMTKDNIGMAQTTGGSHEITPDAASLVMVGEEVKVELRSA